MIIETKFSLGDEFYFLDGNKIRCEIVGRIKIDKEWHKTISYDPLFERHSEIIKYGIEHEAYLDQVALSWEYIDSHRCFKTKQELLDSL